MPNKSFERAARAWSAKVRDESNRASRVSQDFIGSPSDYPEAFELINPGIEKALAADSLELDK